MGDDHSNLREKLTHFDDLPFLVQESLETLVGDSDDNLELGTAYDVLWRYVRKYNHLRMDSNPWLDESVILETRPALTELVNFCYDLFDTNRGVGMFELTVHTAERADNYYRAAIRENPSFGLSYKRLALMGLTGDAIFEAKRWLKELNRNTDRDIFSERIFEQISQYSDYYRPHWKVTPFDYLNDGTDKMPPGHWTDDLTEFIRNYEEQCLEFDNKWVTICRSLDRDNPILRTADWTLSGVEKYVRDNPDDEAGYLEFHRQLVFRDSLGFAYRVLRDAAEEHPEFYEARKQLAMCRYRWKGEWDMAFSELNELRAHLPNDPQISISLIHLYDELGMVEETTELWEQILRCIESEESDIKEIVGTRNEVYRADHWRAGVMGLDFNIIAKFYPHNDDLDPVEPMMIEAFREIAEQRPELDLLASLPPVKYFHTESPRIRGCLIQRDVSGPLLSYLSPNGKANHIPYAIKTLAAIHAASFDFEDGFLVDILEEQEDYFEKRIQSILLDALPPETVDLAEQFIASYTPISAALKSLPRCYYKDANLKNWLRPRVEDLARDKTEIIALDFENNALLPPQLDLVSLLEFGDDYLDETEMTYISKSYYTLLSEYTQLDFSASLLSEAYSYAGVQRHFELMAYRKRDFLALEAKGGDSVLPNSADGSETMIKQIQYHANKCKYHLEILAMKSSGSEGEEIHRLLEIFPKIAEYFIIVQP